MAPARRPRAGLAPAPNQPRAYPSPGTRQRISPWGTVNHPSGAAAQRRHASAIRSSAVASASPSATACSANVDAVTRSAHVPPHQARSSGASKRQADELAVDHALVRRGLPALSYARALYLLSTRATAPGAMLAPGMAAFLPRRIAMLLNPAPASPRAARLLTASVLALAAPLGWAADGLVASPALTPAEVSAAVVQLHADPHAHSHVYSLGLWL